VQASSAALHDEVFQEFPKDDCKGSKTGSESGPIPGRKVRGIKHCDKSGAQKHPVDEVQEVVEVLNGVEETKQISE
jgi:hypothetical protein